MKTLRSDIAIVVVFLAASVVAWPIEHRPRVAVSILIALVTIVLVRSLWRLMR